jgi:hypothetical protein
VTARPHLSLKLEGETLIQWSEAEKEAVTVVEHGGHVCGARRWWFSVDNGDDSTLEVRV